MRLRPVDRHHRSGFSLIELLLVIAVIAVLASIISISYPRVKERAEAATCMSQMKILGVALGTYLSDHNRWPQLPQAYYADDNLAARFWFDSLENYGMPLEKWTCPSLKRNAGPAFAELPIGDQVSYHPTPFDNHPGTPTRNAQMPWAIEASGDHPTGQNILFLDGRVTPGLSSN